MVDINSLTFGLFIVAFTAYTVNIFLQWRRLSHIPGPKIAAFSRFWSVGHLMKKQQPMAFTAANEKYGSVVRVGPNQLITNNPDVLRKILGVRSTYTRSSWYTSMKFDPARENLVSQRDDAEHTRLRAKMAAGYSGKENELLESSMDKIISNLISLIESKYLTVSDSVQPLDWTEKSSFFTMDVISELAFGKAFGYLETDSDVYDYLAITKSFVPYMMFLTEFPWLTKILQSKFLAGLLPKETDRIGLGACIGVAKQVVAQRYGPDAKVHPDMLGSFVRHGLTQEEASSEVLLQIIAGSDTSATTIRTIMFYVVSNPIIYHKLQEEIDTGIAEGKISSPILDAEGRQMPYLQAVIKEGLRILPPVPGHMLKTVPKGGDVLDGVFIPGGTEIGPNMVGVQRLRKVYGEDVDIFRPERWLEADEERLAKMQSTVDLVFNYGKWQCLGKQIGLMEFNKLFVELLRRFDFCIARPEIPAKLSNVGFWYLDDFWLRAEARKL